MSEARNAQMQPDEPTALAALPAELDQPFQTVSMTRAGLADVMFDETKFRQVQRVAKLFLQSGLIPKAIRGESTDQGVANVVLAFALALEMRENPVIVMQNVYFVHGTPGWKTTYCIAKANRARVFKSRIRWATKDLGEITITRKEKTGWDNNARKPTYKETPVKARNLEVTASAELAEGGPPVTATLSLAQAEKQGWTENEKYHSNPELMLQYRTASQLIRLYIPEVMLGYSTAEELETIPREELAPPSIPAIIETTARDVPKVEPIRPDVAPPAEKSEPAPRRTRSRAAAAGGSPPPTEGPLSIAHGEIKTLIETGAKAGWLSDGAAGGYGDRAAEHFKAGNLDKLQETFAELELIRDSFQGEQEQGE